MGCFVTNSWRSVLTTAGIALASLPLQANDTLPIEFSGSGFATLAAGKIVGGTPDNRTVNPEYLGYRGPHFIADWAQGGVYEGGGPQIKPDSRIGFQGSATVASRFSLTTQIVARGARDGAANLEWLYGSAKLTDHVTLQAGRKRLPILFYSESQDVGISYPWIHLPPDIYGWQVVNYDGANLMMRDQREGWSYTLNLFAGNERNRDARYEKLYHGKDSRTEVRWTNIRGGELIAAKDWLEGRLGHFRNQVNAGTLGSGTPGQPYEQRIYTLGLALDHNDWVAHSEYYFADLSPVGERDHAYVVTLGRRFGKWLPMLAYSNYRTSYVSTGQAPDSEERHDTRSFVMRYDLSTVSALKLQYDDYRDHSGAQFRARGTVAGGNARLVSVSYDLVF
jgi:hypothetical protein